MTIEQILDLAKKHAHNGAVMQSSAVLCLETAEQHYDYGRYSSAEVWAIKSLAYSVGVFHPDYQAAKAG